jgi:hypothetical protein
MSNSDIDQRHLERAGANVCRIHGMESVYNCEENVVDSFKHIPILAKGGGPTSFPFAQHILVGFAHRFPRKHVPDDL